MPNFNLNLPLNRLQLVELMQKVVEKYKCKKFMNSSVDEFHGAFVLIETVEASPCFLIHLHSESLM